MKIRSASLAASFTLFLAACATTDPEIDAARQTWRGASYDDVIAAWGPPNRIDKSGPQEKHIWVTEGRVERPRSTIGFGVGMGGGRGNVGVGVGVGGGQVLSTSVEPVRCERALIVSEGRVVTEGEWSGDPGWCRSFARPPQR